MKSMTATSTDKFRITYLSMELNDGIPTIGEFHLSIFFTQEQSNSLLAGDTVIFELPNGIDFIIDGRNGDYENDKSNE